MTGFARCAFQEEGWFFGIGEIVLAIIIVGLVLVVAFALIRGLFAAGRTNDRQWRFDADIPGLGAYKFERSSALVVGTLLCAWIIYYLMSLVLGWYQAFEHRYATALDMSTPRPLGEVRDKLQPFSDVEIVLDPSLAAIQISGHYEGQCVPDFFLAICRQYNSQMMCEPEWFGSKLTIEPIAPRT